MTEPELPDSADDRATLDEVEGLSRRDSHTDPWHVRGADEASAEEGEHATELVDQVVAERYHIKGLLGRGGMGAVYLAEHIELQKQVALKVLHRCMSTNEEVVARFEREAVAAGRLSHPSVVAATDFGRIEDGSFYLALEFIHGTSLADAMSEEGRFSPQRAVSVAYQITDALCAAHDEKIVHRDLKPDNVLLVKTDEGHDLVKVVDFGIAKMNLDEDHQEGLTRAGLVFGTPEYMSPEQALGHKADARSDLYGVGMLLYEMLSGSSPFHADDVTSMLRAQIKDEPPPLPEEIPERLRKVVFWLLEKSPEDRPENAHELLDELSVISQSLEFSLPPPRTSSGLAAERRRKLSSSGARLGGEGADRAPARKSVRKGKARLSLWIPVAGLIVGGTVGVTAMLMNEEVVPTAEVRHREEQIDAEAQLIVDASSGDRDAISELRKLVTAKQKELEESGVLEPVSRQANKGTPETSPAKDSEPGDAKSLGNDTAPPTIKKAGADAAEAVSKQAYRYFVLGRGYSLIKHNSAAVEMYRQAVKLDPHLSEEPELLLDVRLAIAARDAVDDGLDFALSSLGAHGADIIYDVYLDYVGQAGMTPVVARAMKIAKSDELLSQATPALRVALRLQQAQLCGEYRDIIPDAVKYADDRSLQKLRALSARRGCGTHGEKDCFVCLRKDDIDLDAAIAQAETHPSPSFLTPNEIKAERAAHDE